MKRVFVYFLLLISFSFCGILHAQQISVPYECGFEDSVEISNWKLNTGTNGSKCLDQWMIGNLDMNGGFQSLYISCDTGKTTTYGSKPNAVIAYREIELDPSTNSTSCIVDCSFDWKCVGAEGISMLKFYLLPASFISVSDLSSSYNSATLPQKLRVTRPNATLFGGAVWQYWSAYASEQLTFTLNPGQKYYLIFVWENNNKSKLDYPIAACIDNIQLASANCWKPENLLVESTCDTMKVSWVGYNESYEVEYKSADSRVWRGKVLTREQSVVFADLGEGLFDVRVRGICGDSKSSWAIWNNAVSYCPDRHCINFVTLDRDGVICEIGNATDMTTGNYAVGPSPLGPIPGRHTAMWKQNEFDPRTGNKLRTIPEGAIASVRLGDEKPGGLAEGIKYEYLVDTMEAKILLMKYAVVLQKPGHGPKADPGFILEILDKDGKKIDPSCGVFEFTPEKGDFWDEYQGYVWKDWTAIGLNLEQYHGQTVFIHLVTQDCIRPPHGAHTGYAYFTLDCIAAAISNNSCGETVTIEMEAPEGFEYFWTNEKDRNTVISNKQKIDVPADDITTYYCEVRYKGLPNCGFELHTEVKPRFAYADFVWEHKPENCENKVVFTNKSCVSTRVEGVETLTSELCEAFEWKISDGEETSFESFAHTFPNEGGTYDVTLTAYISGGACYDDTTITIVVPPIYEHHDTINRRFCEGDYVEFDDRIIANPGEYIEYKKNIWGCDSVTVLYLDVIPKLDDVHIYDTICSGEEYIFCGKNILKSGTYKEKLLSVDGCDSIVYLDIVVNETLKLDFDELVSTCGGDPVMVLPYQQQAGVFDSCEVKIDFGGGNVYSTLAEVNVDEHIVTFSMPENVVPGYYDLTLSFGERACGDNKKVIPITIFYSKDVIAQRWGDVLAVKNEDYNGGYQFVAFQWYKNGNPIEGATSSICYLSEGVNLSDEYSVLLTRASDGVSVMTCVVELYDYSVVEDDRVVVFNTDGDVAVESSSRARMKIWSSNGILVDELMIEDGYNLVSKHKFTGIYFFEFIFEDGTRDIRKVIF